MRNWYQQARAEIEFQYGDDADLFCDLLAATSPRKQVSANWRLAKQVYDDWKSSRRFDAVCAAVIVNYSVSGLLPCHKSNVVRALSGQELRGPKVRAFAANLKGDLDQVTVDVWMLRFFGFDKDTKRAHQVVVESVELAAAIVQIKPAEMQAVIWGMSVRDAGREPKSYLGAAYEDRQMEFSWR